MNQRSDNRPSNRTYCPIHGKMARHGFYIRRSDSKKIDRWRCNRCGKTISQATGTACFGQNKRRANPIIKKLLSSGVSQRRIALILGIDKNTVARKKKFLACQARLNHQLLLKATSRHSICHVQFDEMESFEHTKLKPVSIAVIVCSQTRRILAVKASEMPAKGLLARKSVKKYGKRKDHRKEAMVESLKKLRDILAPFAELTSDKKSSYPGWIRTVSSNWVHIRVKGRKPCSIGQGELKEGRHDPLFFLNHTCAMIRDSVKRLSRRNWCTTKKIECLQDHLDIYQDFHNNFLVK